MIGDVLAFIDFLRKYWTEYSIKSALFTSDGKRIEGDSFIEVDKIPMRGNDKVWFYKVKDKLEYESRRV